MAAARESAARMSAARDSASRSSGIRDQTAAEVEPSLGVGLQSSLIIDCDSCQMRDITCDDCVVSFLIGPPQDRSSQSQVVWTGASPVTLARPEAEAIATLADMGLVPPLRLVPLPDRSN